tara:strand:+ start:2097 stop:2282 length:186 start_codon:yes stop_codon:yes gene_type:complete
LEQTLEEGFTGTGLTQLTVLDGVGAINELVGAERFDVDMLCHVSIVTPEAFDAKRQGGSSE